MVHDSHQRSAVTAQTPLYRWVGDQTVVLMAVALDRRVALQLVGLEVVGELVSQAREGILAGKGQGIRHSLVLKPTYLVNSLFIINQ